ncbi:hypothetical protein F5Y04DRAFT_288336 [Hypomontagnella monticulosa]|nr:hypothetical protein F5Y04DRAFT_288336 [Hypomontagnella monticulosa]
MADKNKKTARKANVDKKMSDKAAKRAEEAAEKAAQRAAKKEAALEEEKEKRRAARAKIELPTHPLDDLLVLPLTQNPPRQRMTNMTYDDMNKSKRVKTNKSGNGKKPAVLFPWEKNEELEKPPSPFDLMPGSMRPDPNSVKALGIFRRFSPEIRSMILRNLLISEEDIQVVKGWSAVYPGKKPALYTAILSTCHGFRQEGMRVLFGENTFLYTLHDSPKQLGKIPKHTRLPIKKYGHLIRHIKIDVPANCLAKASPRELTEAIAKFLPGGGLLEPANLYTLTLDLPAQTNRDLKLEGWQKDPNSVPITNFVGKSNKAKDVMEQLKVQRIRVVATTKDGEVFEYTIDLERHQKRKRDGENYLLANDAEGVKLSPEKQIAKAKVRIYNIPLRLTELATLGFPEANRLGPYWKEITTAKEPEELEEPDNLKELVEPVEPVEPVNKEARVKEWLEGIKA